MTKYNCTIFVDTNVIIECYRVGAWRALTGGHEVETVEECILETQTGQHHQQINEKELRTSLAAVHSVEVQERAQFDLAIQTLQFELDEGEQALWAYVRNRSDCWVLCGPDKASMHCGVVLGHRERLVSLERLLSDLGYKIKTPLKRHYTDHWLQQLLNSFILDSFI